MVMRNKLGFQTPNIPMDITSMLDTKADHYVVMQYDAGGDMLARILERNPNASFTFRWYTRETVHQSPYVIADQARGWIDGILATHNIPVSNFWVQLLNEPNIPAEYDDQSRSYDSREDYIRYGEWEYEAISALHNARPDWRCCCFNYAPGHSEDQPDQGFIAYELPEVRRVTEVAEAIGVHCYWYDAGKGAKGLDDAESPWYFQRYRKVHEFFPDMPLIINEANGGNILALPEHSMRVEAANELLRAVNITSLEPYIIGCNFFIWRSPGHPEMGADEVIELFKNQDLPEFEFKYPLEEAMPVDYEGATWAGQAKAYEQGRGTKNIQRIVLHWTVGDFQATGNTFLNPTAQASAHYVVGRERDVHQFVRDADTAFHVEPQFVTYNVNQESIGIEVVAGPVIGSPTEIQYQSLAALVRAKCTQYGIPIDASHIHGHREFTATQCPGTLNLSRVIQEASIELHGPPHILAMTEQQRVNKLVEFENTNAHLVKVLNDIRTQVNATIP